MKKYFFGFVFFVVVSTLWAAKKTYKTGEWWLPSKDELDLVYQNQKDAVLETCDDKWHWSSSECRFNLAWLKRFGDGDWLNYYKVKDESSVRAVRAF